MARLLTKVVHEAQNLTRPEELVYTRHLQEPPRIIFRIVESAKDIRTCDSEYKKCAVQNLSSDRRNGFRTDG